MGMAPNNFGFYVIQHRGICWRGESDSLIVALVCYLGDMQNVLDSAIIVLKTHGVSCDCEQYFNCVPLSANY